MLLMIYLPLCSAEIRPLFQATFIFMIYLIFVSLPLPFFWFRISDLHLKNKDFIANKGVLKERDTRNKPKPNINIERKTKQVGVSKGDVKENKQGRASLF